MPWYPRATWCDGTGVLAGVGVVVSVGVEHMPPRDAFSAHVMLMSLSFGLLLPILSLAYRVLEAYNLLGHVGSRRVHALLACAALLATTSGTWAMVRTRDGTHVASVHSAIGACALLMLVLQIASGAAGVACGMRCVFTWHRPLGRVIVHLGGAAMATGLALHAGRRPTPYWQGDCTAALLVALQMCLSVVSTTPPLVPPQPAVALV